MVPDAIRSIVPHDRAFIGYAAVIFLIVFAVAGIAAIRSRAQSSAWMVMAVLVTARLENGVLHLIESVMLMQYTPGVITAVLLVLPLSLYLLARMLKTRLIASSSLPVIIAAAFVVQAAAIGAMLLLGQLDEPAILLS